MRAEQATDHKDAIRERHAPDRQGCEQWRQSFVAWEGVLEGIAICFEPLRLKRMAPTGDKVVPMLGSFRG